MDTRKDTLAVPKDAIIEDNTRRYVMLVKAASAETPSEEAEGGDSEVAVADTPEATGDRWVATRVEVEVGLSDSDFTEIVSGVTPDDRVITLGQQTVNDGDAVEISSIEEALASKESLGADEALETAKKRAESESEDGGRKPRRRGP